MSAQQNVNAFDAEGHAVRLEGIGVTYDALGRAVEAVEPNGAIEFLYGPGGGKLAVMSGQTLGTAYVPLPGGGTAVYHGAALAYYRHADGLGSSRLASTPSRTLYSATAYAPFGEPHQESGTIDRNFTGQNQGITGGQYDFLMREFNPIQGRWWTPDPAGLAAVDPNNPQSWNRYAYVNGHPLGSMDPLGLWPVPCTSASLHKPSSDAQAVGFGPYEPDEDGAAADASGGDDCGSGGDPWQQCSLDGVDMGCGTMWDLGSGGGALPGGGGIPGATLTSCPWYACQPTVPGQDGDPHQWGWGMVDHPGPGIVDPKT
ncbi:MAG TPA: RHS repeat-associated core domain-containing protein, partial [Terriglobales bacterium]|nr:RHS repeat-associated core domain-containing protein [Terriglobales bacterium]